MNWETLVVTTKEIEEQPFIFLVPEPDTRMVWNYATQALLHGTGHVELVVDREKRCFGVRPCAGEAPHAIGVNKLSLRTAANGDNASSRWWLDLTHAGVDAAFRRAGINWPPGQKGYVRNASRDGDVVYIPMDELMAA